MSDGSDKDARIFQIRGKALIPLTTLLDVTGRSPYYRDEDKVYKFYAESWALTHYLMVSDEMERGKKLNKFFDLLQQGEDQKKAFQESIGDLKQIQDKLDSYISRFAFPAMVMNNPPHTDESEFSSRRLSEAETDAELSTLYVWNRNGPRARSLLEQALKSSPDLALAHENLGFLNFSEGKDDAAVREFSRAYELDPKLYLSLFYRTMLSPLAKSSSQQEMDKFHDALMKVLDTNRQFAPVYIQLAFLEMRRGDLEHALALSRKAEQLEPARAGYHILSGRILLALGRAKEAALFARYVAERWEGPDHNEAVELWNSIPPQQRPEGVTFSEKYPDGVKTATGKIKSVTCDKEDGLSLVMDRDGQLVTFNRKGPYSGGFSDTLWYGEDHFSFCQHLAGMHAVVSYRPASEKGDSGELATLEIRDEVPHPAAAAKPEAATPTAASQPQK